MLALLFDANISYRIKKQLQNRFETIFHVSDFSKGRLSDSDIWQIAKDKSLTIVSYDEDFNEIQTIKGFPPKAIRLRFGNQTTVYIANKLLVNEKAIQQFVDSPDLGILEIY